MRRGGTLGVLDVLQQASGRAHGHRRIFGIESRQIAGPELATQRPLGGLRVEVPGRPLPKAFEIAQPTGLWRVFGQQGFGRPQPLQFASQRVAVRQFGNGEPAAGHVEPGQSNGAGLVQVDCCQVRGPLRIQQRVFGERSRGDDAYDFPGHGPLACLWVADLLADGHGLAQAHEPAQVIVRRTHRYTRHGNGFAARLPPAGQRDVHQLGGPARVVEEEFVKVPHAVEEQHIGMLGLDAQVLLHHGGVGFVQGSAVRGRSSASRRDPRGGFGATRTL